MVTATRNHGLGKRGLAVFRALGGTKLDVPRRELAVEAGRMADRLEHLDQQINGGEHMLKMLHFRMRSEVEDDGTVTIELVMDKALAEARQLQLAYERIVKTLAAPAESQVPKKDVADDISARIAARRAAAGS